MSIAYQQADDRLEAGALRHELTEYDRRKSKAEKEAMDAVQMSERRASLGAGGNSFKRTLSRKSSDASRAAQLSPRSHLPVSPRQLPVEHPVGSLEKGVEEASDEEDPAKLKDWWKRTDSASLNRKPDKALADESTNTQFHSYSYKPQFDVAGVHCPEYFKLGIPPKAVH